MEWIGWSKFFFYILILIIFCIKKRMKYYLYYKHSTNYKESTKIVFRCKSPKCTRLNWITHIIFWFHLVDDTIPIRRFFRRRTQRNPNFLNWYFVIGLGESGICIANSNELCLSGKAAQLDTILPPPPLYYYRNVESIAKKLHTQ